MQCILVDQVKIGHLGFECILKQITHMGISIMDFPICVVGDRPKCIAFIKTSITSINLSMRSK